MPRRKTRHESEEERCTRLNANRLSQQLHRQRETDDQRQKRQRLDRQRHYVCYQQATLGRKTTMNVAKALDVSMYQEDLAVRHTTGSFTGWPCTHCGAFKWKDESESTCCAKGKVKLHPIKPLPPRMVRLYDINENPHFLKNIVAYNNLLALASLGYNEPNDGVHGFRPTFKSRARCTTGSDRFCQLPVSSQNLPSCTFMTQTLSCTTA